MKHTPWPPASARANSKGALVIAPANRGCIYIYIYLFIVFYIFLISWSYRWENGKAHAIACYSPLVCSPRKLPLGGRTCHLGPEYMIFFMNELLRWCSDWLGQKGQIGFICRSGWWIWNFFPYIGSFIIPTDKLIFFRRVAQPPTRYGCCNRLSTVSGVFPNIFKGFKPSSKKNGDIAKWVSPLAGRLGSE